MGKSFIFPTYLVFSIAFSELRQLSAQTTVPATTTLSTTSANSRFMNPVAGPNPSFAFQFSDLGIPNLSDWNNLRQCYTKEMYLLSATKSEPCIEVSARLFINSAELLSTEGTEGSETVVLQALVSMNWSEPVWATCFRRHNVTVPLRREMENVWMMSQGPGMPPYYYGMPGFHPFPYLLPSASSAGNHMYGPSAQFRNEETSYVVNPDGTASTTYEIQTRLLCRTDMTNFPYDTQECPIVMESPSNWPRRSHYQYNNVSLQWAELPAVEYDPHFVDSDDYRLVDVNEENLVLFSTLDDEAARNDSKIIAKKLRQHGIFSQPALLAFLRFERRRIYRGELFGFPALAVIFSWVIFGAAPKAFQGITGIALCFVGVLLYSGHIYDSFPPARDSAVVLHFLCGCLAYLFLEAIVLLLAFRLSDIFKPHTKSFSELKTFALNNAGVDRSSLTLDDWSQVNTSDEVAVLPSEPTTRDQLIPSTRLTRHQTLVRLGLLSVCVLLYALFCIWHFASV